MLTVNVELSDRLVIGQLGTVDNTVFTESGISKIYLKFDDPSLDKQLMCTDFYSTKHQAVPSNRVESHISLTRKNNLHMISRTQVSLNNSICMYHSQSSRFNYTKYSGFP